MDALLEWIASGEIINLQISPEILLLIWLAWTMHKRVTATENRLTVIENHINGRESKIDELLAVLVGKHAD